MRKLTAFAIALLLGTLAAPVAYAQSGISVPGAALHPKWPEDLEGLLYFVLGAAYETGASERARTKREGRGQKVRARQRPFPEKAAKEDARRAGTRQRSEIWAAFRQAWNGLNENNEAHFNRGRRRLGALLRDAPANSGNSFLAEALLGLLPPTFSNGLVYLDDYGSPIADPDAFIRSQLRRLAGLSESDGAD